jgi:hypothetical protein
MIIQYVKNRSLSVTRHSSKNKAIQSEFDDLRMIPVRYGILLKHRCIDEQHVFLHCWTIATNFHKSC